MAKKIKFYAEIKSPPLENEARSEIGSTLRLFQEGEIPGEPAAKPIHQIGKLCYEIRHKTAQHNWRIYLAVRTDIAVLLVEDKKSDSISKTTIKTCKSRLRSYELAEKELNKEAL
jgi:phage-related protein